MSATVDATADRELTIVRVFEAPRALVFRAWTDPKLTMRWMGPRGFQAGEFRQDVRPGGAWRGCLHPEDGGRDLWFGGIYRDVAPPERLVFTFAWDQEDGSRGPETLVTIVFAEHAGRTSMTFHQSAFDTPTNRDGHVQGWISSFDRLVEFLKEATA